MPRENFFWCVNAYGGMGCEKTYLTEHGLTDLLGENFIVIHISLFGESSVENINRKVQKAYF